MDQQQAQRPTLEDAVAHQVDPLAQTVHRDLVAWCEKPAAMRTIRGFRQSIDSAASEPSLSLTSASNS
ncbi:hypothetical protein ABZ883_12860 [Streptomyces sp. NPDC046977]|uniref:hypothetical protein n=1 Tax=Streptomyces sp. NPDC046977 TaxID=3154703 RepID=UPI0033E6FECB